MPFHEKKAKKALIYCSAFILIVMIVGSTVIFLNELPLDLVKAKSCTVISCMMTKYKGFPHVEYLPGYFNLAFNTFTGLLSAAYFGEYTKMFCMIDSACCAIYFYYVFMRRKNSGKVTQSAPSRSQINVAPIYLKNKLTTC
uniref:Uncharacterized protein n=1 Tax=Ditylenchus dipsaci TaxID=166011 RepID=A0A915EVN0_9BILA